MRRLRAWCFRFAGLFRKGQRDREFAAELESHVQMHIEDNLRCGMDPTEARRQALIKLGGVEQAKEEYRDRHGIPWLEALFQDVRYTLRTMRRSPGFTAVAVLTLALGVGANAAVFSVVNAVLLRPLPYHDPDRIVTLASSATGRPLSDLYRQVSIPDFQDWQAQSTAFQTMGYYGARQTSVTIGSTAEYVQVARVAPDFFRVFDVQPIRGRSFIADEEKPGGSGAAIITDAFGRHYFGGSDRALGQTIRVFGRTVLIVGVLPVWFDFPARAEVWFPDDTLADPTRTSRSALNRLAVGRLKSDASLERAQAEMASIAARLQQQYPTSNEGRNVTVTRLHDDMVGNVRLMLYLLLSAVGLVLVIACANLATLLLARATARTQEIAVRAALGASRGRLVQQMLTEGVVLALISGLAGVVFAVWGTKALVALAPPDVPRLAEATVNAPVLVFTLLVSVTASLLLALVPAFQASRIDMEHTLRLGGTRGSVGGRTGRVRETLVMAELALSVVLLATGGLLIKSLLALQHVSLGFRPENVLVMDATISTSDPRSGATLFFRSLLRDVSTIPGVVAAGATMTPPGRIDSASSYWIDHLPKDLNINAPQAVNSVIAQGTFAALGIPLKRGRDFHDGDTRDAASTAIVNEALVRQSLPGQDAIGHTIYCGFDSLNPMTIVGIVGNVRQLGPEREPRPECYMPYLQHFYNGATLSLVVRSAIDPTALVEAVRRKAHELSPDVPVKFTTMEALMAEHVAAPRFRALLVGFFAAVALFLAILGIFGVMVYIVSQRTAEIGLRMALGATPADVLWLLLRRGLVLTIVGLAAGLVTAVIAMRFFSSMLFEVKPTDPMAYLAVAGVLGITSLLAIYIPARRAPRMDPMVALRHE